MAQGRSPEPVREASSAPQVEEESDVCICLGFLIQRWASKIPQSALLRTSEHGNSEVISIPGDLNPEKEECESRKAPSETCPIPTFCSQAAGFNPRTRVKTPSQQWVGEDAAGGEEEGESFNGSCHVCCEKKRQGSLREGSSNYWRNNQK
jgi:hypothetical protein